MYVKYTLPFKSVGSVRIKKTFIQQGCKW